MDPYAVGCQQHEVKGHRVYTLPLVPGVYNKDDRPQQQFQEWKKAVEMATEKRELKESVRLMLDHIGEELYLEGAGSGNGSWVENDEG